MLKSRVYLLKYLLSIIIFCSIFGCKDTKNGNEDTPQSVKFTPAQVYDCIEESPIFDLKTENINNYDTSKISQCLISKEDNLKSFINTSNNDGINIEYKVENQDAFFRWLKSRYNEKFHKIVQWQYITEKFDKSVWSDADRPKLEQYRTYIKKKFSEKLNKLSQVDVFCKGLNNKQILKENRKVLLLAYMIFVYKDFHESPMYVLERIDGMRAFDNVMSREDIISFLFLFLAPNNI